MKHFILFVLSLFLSLMMISCNNSYELLENEAVLTNNTISASTAEKVATAFKQNNTLFTRSHSNTIINQSTINDNSGAPLFHIINYNDGGYIVVSGDDRIEPILAYADEGYFEYDPENYGLCMWVDNISENIKYVRNNNLKQNEEIKSRWDTYLKTIETRTVPGEGGLPEECDIVIGPLLSDQWHQFSPYNDSISDYCVGCVPLAIARVMRYYQSPSSYSWSSMPNTGATNYTKSFIKNVFFSIWNYLGDSGFHPSSTGTATSHALSIAQFLSSQYNYTGVVDINYNATNCDTLTDLMLEYECPVILRGQFIDVFGDCIGHAWICDGCHHNVIHSTNEAGETIATLNTYFHYCWGRPGGQHDGWFFRSNVTEYSDSINTYNYNQNMKITYFTSF